MSNYTWKWDLDEKGFVEVPFSELNECQFRKLEYVKKYLSPSIQKANCGWNHAVYYVLKNERDTREYIALYPETENVNGRYINVSGNSLGYVAKEVWNNMFN